MGPNKYLLLLFEMNDNNNRTVTISGAFLSINSLSSEFKLVSFAKSEGILWAASWASTL